MIVDFTQPFLGLTGAPVNKRASVQELAELLTHMGVPEEKVRAVVQDVLATPPASEGFEPLTFGFILAQQLIGPDPGADERRSLRRVELALAMSDAQRAAAVEICEDDVADILACAWRAWAASGKLMYYRVHQLFARARTEVNH
jgi:hypothetical protein